MLPEQPCATPGTTPMAGSGTTGRIGLFRSLVRQDCPEDPKRLVVMASAAGLIYGFAVIARQAAHQVAQGHDIAGGTVGALLGIGALLAGLAGYVHHKADDPMPGGPQ